MDEIEIFEGLRVRRRSLLHLFLFLGLLVTGFFVYLAKTEGLTVPPKPHHQKEQSSAERRDLSTPFKT